MTLQTKVVNEIEKEGKTLAFSPFSENLIRVGYGALGLIYLIIGFLAIKIAFGVSGSLQDQQGAITSIGQQLFGRILLGIVLIGLVGYTLWGLIRAFLILYIKEKILKVF